MTAGDQDNPTFGGQDSTDETEDQATVEGFSGNADSGEKPKTESVALTPAFDPVVPEVEERVENTVPFDAAPFSAGVEDVEAVESLAVSENSEENEESASLSVESSFAVETKKAEVVEEVDKSKMPWYVVHTYSGFEQQAKLALEERIRIHNLHHKFGNILIPQETVVELVRGKKKTSTRKFFPGYILVQMALDEDSWHLVRETPKVTGFVGDSQNPSPMTAQEVEGLFRQLEGGTLKPRAKMNFEKGDVIKVVDGPFADFNGTVDDVKPDKGKLRVLISIFGRNTPVELDFIQVEKA